MGKSSSVIDSDFSFLVISPLLFLLRRSTKQKKNRPYFIILIPTCSHPLGMLLRILLVFNRSRFEILIDLLDWFLNSVRSESLFDSASLIPLLLVRNNGIIPSYL